MRHLPCDLFFAQIPSPDRFDAGTEGRSDNRLWKSFVEFREACGRHCESVHAGGAFTGGDFEEGTKALGCRLTPIEHRDPGERRRNRIELETAAHSMRYFIVSL